MVKTNRRTFLKTTGTLAAGSLVTGFPTILSAAGQHVVVVGGGVGGATAAKYLRIAAPEVNITLIEPNQIYHTCFMSNEVISGYRNIESIQFRYGGLAYRGINIVHDFVVGIDPVRKQVQTGTGILYEYDRCIVSPGIDFKWRAIGGYDAKISRQIPHAWKAGAQTLLLRKQLEAMDDGGRVIIIPPPNPFRCPPGPYERASQIASYLKAKKKRSKILILDAKDKFSKQGLFTQAWKRLYGYGTDNSMIEWVPASTGGQVDWIKADEKTVQADLELHKGDVINLIPPQKAGAIAFKAGLTKGDWCPVNKMTFESTLQPAIHVIGDASIASSMPKSGYSANSQAKVAAYAVAAQLKGLPVPEPSYVNTCYSIAGKEYAFSVAAVYNYDQTKNMIAKVKGSGGLTPMDASSEQIRLEALYAHSWFNNITRDIFG